VAVACPAITGDGINPPGHVEYAGGQLIAGGVLQVLHSTVTLNESVATLPQTSTAVNITVVVPPVKLLPLAILDPDDVNVQSSEYVGGVHVTGMLQ